MLKHTEGPWKVCEDREEGYYVYSESTGHVPASGILLKENARLIAAAPKLLDFLRDLLDNDPDGAVDLLTNYGPELLDEAEGRDYVYLR